MVLRIYSTSCITVLKYEYIKRISIENDKIALPKDKRDGLLAGIRSVIDRYGGTLTLYTTTDLNLARKM